MPFARIVFNVEVSPAHKWVLQKRNGTICYLQFWWCIALAGLHGSEEPWCNARHDGKLLCIYMFILWFAFCPTEWLREPMPRIKFVSLGGSTAVTLNVLLVSIHYGFTAWEDQQGSLVYGPAFTSISASTVIHEVGTQANPPLCKSFWPWNCRLKCTL